MPKKNEIQYGEKLSTQTEFRKATALEDGQSIEGTVLGFRDSDKYPGNLSIVMRGLDGKQFTLTPAGNIRYAMKNGQIQIGTTYKIQREGSRNVKGKVTSNFGIYPALNAPETSSADSNNSDI